MARDTMTPDLFGHAFGNQDARDRCAMQMRSKPALQAAETRKAREMLRELTIPQIRDRLFALAEDLRLPILADLAEATRRRRPAHKAPKRKRNPTPAKAAEIKAFAIAHPDMGYFEIGQKFGVGVGRVSEAVAGKRGERT